MWQTTLAAAYPEPLCRVLAEAFWEAIKKEPHKAKPKPVKYDAMGQNAPHELESRRRRQDRENNQCLGGLRRPHRSIKRLPGYADVGAKLQKIMVKIIRHNKKDFEAVLGTLGTDTCNGIPKHIIYDTRKMIEQEFMINGQDEELGLQGLLFKALLEAAGDPEIEVPQWLSGYAPLGIENEIKPAGVFPQIDARSVGPEIGELMELVPGWQQAQKMSKQMSGDGNYTSYADHQEAAEEELAKEHKNGYFKWYPNTETAEQNHGEVTISRVGAIVSQKNGKQKTRLIHDLRRSLVNSKITICERLVLPRMCDAIEDGIEVLLSTTDGQETELAVLRVAPNEQGYLAGKAWNGIFVYLVILFGVGSGPLVWGRVAAATMRITQAMLGQFGRANCYVDDTLLFIKGTKTERREMLMAVILLWRALGLKLAWRKAEYGRQVRWIGAQVEVDTHQRILYVTVPAEKLRQLQADCNKWIHGTGMIHEKELRAFAGRGSWLGGLLPQVRPFYRQIWGALAAPRQEGRRHLIFKKQIITALYWLMTLADKHVEGLTRKIFADDQNLYGVTIISDASPWGGGALLWPSWASYSADEPASQYLQIVWNSNHERLISGKIGLPDFQADWEALMIVIALKTWTSAGTRGMVTVIGDASGVISGMIAMRARATGINNLIREAALHLAPFGLTLEGLHVWAEHNTQADELSRLKNSKSTPSWLQTDTTKKATPTSCEPQAWPHCTCLPSTSATTPRASLTSSDGRRPAQTSEALRSVASVCQPLKHREDLSAWEA